MERGVTSERRVGEIVHYAGVSAAARANQLDAIARFDRDKLWREDGVDGMTIWLTTRFPISRRTATEWIRMGHALHQLPHIAAAFQAGELYEEQVAILTRYATPESDERLANWARGRAIGDLLCDEQDTRHPNREEAEQQVRSRDMRMRVHEGKGMLTFWGQAPLPEGLAVKEALDREACRMGEQSGEHCEPYGTRLLDALVNLVTTGLDKPRSPERPLVTVFTTADQLGIGDGGRLKAGPAISNATVERLLCTSRTRLIATGKDGEPIGVGRASADPPPWLEDLVWERDKHCTFVSCTATQWLTIHHIDPYCRGSSSGGATDLPNLTLCCTTHHYYVHELGWTVRRLLNGELEWRRPDCTIVDPRPPRLSQDAFARVGLPPPPVV